MSLRNIKLLAVGMVALATQIGCYNSYTIDKNELAKLESSVERVEMVEVLADCPEGSVAYRSLQSQGVLLAEADGEEGAEATATDGMAAAEPKKKSRIDEATGCTRVPVSTVNALTVLISDGSRQRVTPFNFVMDQVQLVSPEYDLLVQLDQVDGAEVREFSTWKTVATITGVSLVSIGTFVGISILAPDEGGFN